jgi:MFS family permease
MESASSTTLHTPDKQKLWTAPFILFMAINAIAGTATQMITPLMAKYLTSKGATLELAALITAILSAVALVGRPFSGAANDFMNKKKIMFFSSMVVGLCLLGYSFTASIPMIIVLRIIHGLAFCFQGTTTMAFSASFIPRERFGEGMGYMGLTMIVSSSIGPNIGVLLTDNYGTNVCFGVAAVISLIASAALLTVPYQFVKRQRPEGYKFRIRMSDLFAKELFLLSAFVGIFSIGNGLINTYLKLLAEERNILNVGLYFTANALMMVAVRPFVGRLLDKKGLTIIMIPAYLIASIGMMFISSASATWMLVAAGILKAIGQGSGAPSIQAASVKILGKAKAGVASSTCYIGQDIGNIIGPIVGGFVVTRYSFAAVFQDYAILLVLTAAAFVIYNRVSFKNVEKATLLPQEAPVVAE